MSRLVIYDAASARPRSEHVEGDAIAGELARIGVRFERWRADAELAPDAGDADVLAAYERSVQELKEANGFAAADVIAVGPDHPQREALRARFQDEHTHGEFEVRFFVSGRGLFYLHVGDAVHAVLCEQGDLLSVPAGVTHWFDMGARPSLRCIRLFTSPEGWVADYTGDAIAGRFPTLEDFLGSAP